MKGFSVTKFKRETARGLAKLNRLNLRRTKGVDASPSEVFLCLFLEDQTSALDVFSSCSFIRCASLRAFQTCLVMISYYGYEI